MARKKVIETRKTVRVLTMRRMKRWEPKPQRVNDSNHWLVMIRSTVGKVLAWVLEVLEVVVVRESLSDGQPGRRGDAGQD